MKVQLILDSGAYSAWRQRDRISFKEYVQYIEARWGEFYKVVNLDVIASVPGRRASPSEVEESAKKSWKNLQRLRKEGIDPLPVFHRGERLYWLDKIIGEGYEWVGFGATHMATRERHLWLDRLFSHVAGDDGLPVVDIHGFGVASFPTMVRYPWATLDSTSWISYSSYGTMIVPPILPGGDWDFGRSPRWIGVSERSSGYTHFNTLSPTEQEACVEWIEYLGYTLEELGESYEHRASLAAAYFLESQKARTLKPFTHREGFFGTRTAVRDRNTHQVEHTRMFFGGGGPKDPAYCRALTRAGAFDRLVSYYYLKDVTTNWDSYFRTGLVPSKKKRERF